MRGTQRVAHVAMRLVATIPPPPATTSERADSSAIQDVVEPESGLPQPDIVIGPRTMSPRAHLRWPLAVLLLCEIARPAFADGSIPSNAEIYGFLFEVAIVIFMAIVVLVLLVRAISIALRRRQDRPADPAVPAARVVQDRSKPS
jgi:hypothetical protein